MKSKIQKNLIFSIFLLATLFTYGQSKSINGMVTKTVKVENISLTVTVDSAEEIESTFKMEDIKEILAESKENETVSFKIICNGDLMSNGKKSHVSYKVEGNSNDRKGFIKSVEKIRASAIKYYSNKN